MADQDKGLAGAGKFSLQPFDGLNVQMVGRLVQQHKFRRLGHQFGQRGPAPLAARSGRNRHIGAEFQPLGHHIHLVSLLLGQTAGRVISQSGKARDVGVLLHIADADAGGHDARAAVRQDEPGHHLHQGGLARAIAAHQRHPVARLDHEVKLVENWIAAKGQRNLREL